MDNKPTTPSVPTLFDELFPLTTPGKWEGNGNTACGYGWVFAEPHVLDTFGRRRQILAGQYGAMHADAMLVTLMQNNIEALIDAAKLLPQALKLIDAHRRISLGDGDLAALGIRDVLKRLNMGE